MLGDDLELRIATGDDVDAISNLWPPYVHDVSAYDGRAPNRYGVIEGREGARSWDGPGDWWSKPDVLFPYLVLVGGAAAGFNLIASGPYVTTKGVDFVVHEFFIANAFRGRGVAGEAARRGIANHRGAWEVVTYPNAPGPIGFWRKTLPACATGDVVETEEDHAFGRKVVFRFHNRER